MPTSGPVSPEQEETRCSCRSGPTTTQDHVLLTKKTQKTKSTSNVPAQNKPPLKGTTYFRLTEAPPSSKSHFDVCDTFPSSHNIVHALTILTRAKENGLPVVQMPSHFAVSTNGKSSSPPLHTLTIHLFPPGGCFFQRPRSRVPFFSSASFSTL